MSPSAKRLVAFAVLGGYASFTWFGLVVGFEAERWIGSTAVAVACGATLLLIDSRVDRRRSAWLIAVPVVLIALVAGLAAVGIPVRLLVPGGWAELSGELSTGLAGLSQIDTPYAGPSTWTALGIAAGAPIVMTVAFAAALWPATRSRAGTAIGLVLLLVLYGTSVTWEAPPDELLRGALLFGAVAAVIWLPQVAFRRALAPVGAVAVAVAVALPLASRVEASDPVISYTDWTIFGEDDRVAYEWDHTYGPIDFPQEGTDLFTVAAERPMYWKTSVLDEFDGARWRRGGSVIDEQRAFELAGVSDGLLERHPEWIEELDFEIDAINSGLVIGSGTPVEFEGIATEPRAGDGTTSMREEALTTGLEYGMTAYVPDPSARLLRGIRDRYPAPLAEYTTLLLPQNIAPLGVTDEAAPSSPLIPVTQPLRGEEDTLPVTFLPFGIDAVVEGTPYERVRRLADRLTAGADSSYQAVESVQRFLLENYEYDQEVPNRDAPLPAFLFRDRAGYCQQFSGAMALMLRMEGIPSRVVSGFAPGLPLEGDDGYEVRDTDAHSWVEVWFPRVGWVVVDPTPSEAPARAEEFAGTAPDGGERGAGLGRAFSLEESVDPGEPPDTLPAVRGAEKNDGGWAGAVPSFALVLLAGALATTTLRRRRRLISREGAGLQLRELVQALERMGHTSTPGATLGAIGERVRGVAGDEAADYVAGLRDNRFAPGLPRRPGPVERRAFRSALARRAGPRGWWHALRAIPPGGPRR